MDQGPLTHTNGGSPGDPHLDPLFAGSKLGVLGGPPGGFWDPPPRARPGGGAQIIPPG